MEDKKFKRLASRDDLLAFFFKNHPLSPQEKEFHEKLNYAFRQIKDEGRIQGAVNALFYHIPAYYLALFEANHPLTIKRLFIVAEDLLAGKFGSIGQAAARAMAHLLFQEKTMQKLLVADALFAHLEVSEWPEILETISIEETALFLNSLSPEQVGEAIFASDRLNGAVEALFWRRETRLAVEQLLRKYLSHLMSPSHVAVDLLIAHEKPIEKSVKVVEQIKNPEEKSKSLVSIVKRLIQTNRVERALDMVRSIQIEQVRTKPLVQLIDQLLNPSRSQFEKMLYANQVDEAIELAKNIQDVSERDKILQKIAYTLAKKDQLQKAEEVVGWLSNQEVQESALSSLVNALSSIHCYQQAKALAISIKDQDFREDACSYIVKGLLLDHQIDEAIAFVDSIQNSIERSKIAAILLSSFISHHDLEHSDLVREKFDLVKQKP